MTPDASLDAVARKIVQKSGLETLCERLRAEGARIVSTNGAFDILHIGHIRSLAYARSLGDVLIVGVNSDDSVRRYKGPDRPIVPEAERALVIAALEVVDYAFVFDDDTPVPWIPLIRPHVHVKGSDRSLEEIVEREIVESFGGSIVLASHTGHSSSALIAKAKDSARAQSEPDSR